MSSAAESWESATPTKGGTPEEESAFAASWRPVNLHRQLGTDRPPVPMVLHRSDGQGLFYKGKVNGLFGPYESMKSWVAQAACASELMEGRTVVYVDMEDDFDAVGCRLTSMGVPIEIINDPTRFAYISPEEPQYDAIRLMIRPLIQSASLVVLDGVTNCFALHGWSTNSTDDTAAYSKFVQGMAKLGPAVLTIDHQTKATDHRQGMAIGSQHKMATIRGAAYEVQRKGEMSSGGGDATAMLIKRKDTPGQLLGVKRGEVAANVAFHSDGEWITYRVNPPGQHQVAPETPGKDRPREEMEKVSMWMEERDERCPVAAMLDEVHIRRETAVRAYKMLVQEGHLATESVGNAIMLSLVAPYRMDDETSDEAAEAARMASIRRNAPTEDRPAPRPAPQGENPHAALHEEVERQRRLRDEDTPSTPGMVNGSAPQAMTADLAAEWVSKLGEPGVALATAASCVDGPSGPVLRRALATAAGRGDERAGRVLALVDEAAEI